MLGAGGSSAGLPAYAVQLVPCEGHVPAKALMRAYEGDVVKMHTPGGVEEIEIVKVTYV